MGLLVVLVRGSSTPGAGIGPEEVAIKASQVQQYAAEIERGVGFILRNGHSESDVRFAHPNAAAAYGTITTNPEHQVFDRTGGGAEYKDPPSNIQTTQTPWQFYATTHMPDVGTDTPASMRAELIAVLPNVTEDFCERINDINDQDIDLSNNHDLSANGCIHAGAGNEFTGTYLSGASTNTPTAGAFTNLPATQACIQCESDSAFHFYHVLLAR